LANARNAQKSTGPRTTAGRAKSSRNALQHGLTARDELLSQPWRSKAVALAMEQGSDASIDEAWIGNVARCLARLDKLRPMKAQSLIELEKECTATGDRAAGRTGLRAYTILNAYERRVRSALAKRITSRPSLSMGPNGETNPKPNKSKNTHA
jgi:hypothetical protein